MKNYFAARTGCAVLLAVLLTVSATVGTTAEAWAEQTVKNLKRGIPVRLKTAIDAPGASVGQPFEAELAEDVRYRDSVIPAGTGFRGQIIQTGMSKRFSRPGYVVLDVQQAELPNGQTFSFEQYPDSTVKIHDEQAKTFGQRVVGQLPYTAAGLAVTIPLRAADAVDNLPLFAIGTGVRAATGALVGLVRPSYRGKPVAYKISQGVLDGTGIKTVVGFVGKSPEAHFETGETIRIYPDRQGLEDLFKKSGSVSAPAQQASPASSLSQ